MAAWTQKGHLPKKNKTQALTSMHGYCKRVDCATCNFTALIVDDIVYLHTYT